MEKSDGRVVSRFEFKVAHAVERVWQAVSVPAELEQWLPSALDWTSKTGETFEAVGAKLERNEVDATRHLACIYLRRQHQIFAIEGQEAGCVPMFTQVFDRRLAAQAAAGWETHLSKLGPYPRGVPVAGSAANERWLQIHGRYVR